jgi:hypothetical protein
MFVLISTNIYVVRNTCQNFEFFYGSWKKSALASLAVIYHSSLL